jgi:hypothetical protein
MKKLNITKKQYDESKYFNNKYGALKFVSESGKLYKTDKGVVLALEGTEEEVPPKEVTEDEDEPGKGEGEEEVTVKKEDLANALQGVIDTVKDIAAENDVELPEEEQDDGEGEGEDDDDEIDLEFDEGNEEVCPTCGAAMKKECGGVKECSGAGCVKKECGKPGLKAESARMRRAKMVRESLLRRARAKKIRESIERRRRARKVLESIRRRRAAKKVLESARKRRIAKKVMESRKLRARRAGLRK